MTSLYEEHLLLGAQFDDGRRVTHYASEAAHDVLSGTSGAYLTDITHVSTLTFSGKSAIDFAQAAFGGKKLEVGECAFEAVFTGDGKIASIPLLARTGAYEYVSFDVSPRADILSAWLSFLATVEKDGFSPYADLVCDDATGTHTALAFWGKQARSVLADYTDERNLPKKGHIVSCNLDRIPCIIASIPSSKVQLFVILVPPASAVALWRSLLSFTEVEPVGLNAFDVMLGANLGWNKRLASTDTLDVPELKLASWGLVRTKDDFVGARALRSQR